MSNDQLLQELRQKQLQLQAFRDASGSSLQAILDHYDWGLISGGGHRGLPLFTLRLGHRISLKDPDLLEIAEAAEQICGLVDFALFSGETREPIRVLSKTLLDLDQHWRRP